MELMESLKALFIETARSLKGSARRVFMARTVQELYRSAGENYMAGSGGSFSGSRGERFGELL